jgi:uncharacterized membrane-anchored protein YhcB (DUF1043 family)
MRSPHSKKAEVVLAFGSLALAVVVFIVSLAGISAFDFRLPSGQGDQARKKLAQELNQQRAKLERERRDLGKHLASLADQNKSMRLTDTGASNAT